MAVFCLPKFVFPLHGSPTPPHSDCKAHAITRPRRPPHTGTHNAKYFTALETEHSRELYLQAAMTVGQIARILEELCADNYDAGDTDADDDDDDGDEEDAEETAAVGESSTHQHPSVAIVIHQFVSHEKRDQIAAWARGVSPANDICIGRGRGQPQSDVDIINLKDADATYLRGAFVVGDIADLLDDLVRRLDDEVDETPKNCEKEGLAAFFPGQVALAQLQVEPSRNPDKIPDADFASRLSCLSARLAKLEEDINTFSQDRTDALKQMELEDEMRAGASQEWDKAYWSGCDEIVEHVDSRDSYMDWNDALGICDVLKSEDGLLLNRVRTMTDTTTSGFSLVTPSGSDAQPVIFESHDKEYFWTLD